MHLKYYSYDANKTCRNKYTRGLLLTYLLILKAKFTQGQYDLALRSIENNEWYIVDKWLTFLAGNNIEPLIINQFKKKKKGEKAEI